MQFLISHAVFKHHNPIPFKCIPLVTYLPKRIYIHHMSHLSQYFHILIQLRLICPCTYLNHFIHFIKYIYPLSVFYASMFLTYHVLLPYHISCNRFYHYPYIMQHTDIYNLVYINNHILNRSISL